MAKRSRTSHGSPTGSRWESSRRARRCRSTDQQPAVPHVSGSWWIELYRLFLFVLIVAYYAVVFAVMVNVLLQAIRLLNVELVTSPVWFALYLTGLSLVILVVAQTAPILWSSLLGLVTTLYDDEPSLAMGHPLLPQDYPELYATVAEVARQVDAPLPDEVRITERGDCYVTEQRRFSIRPARKLLLVLGMPHLSVLSVAELRVILAHELAHFGRGDTSLGVFVFRFLESLRATDAALAQRSLRWVNPLYPFCKLYFSCFLLLSAPIRRQQELRADCMAAAAYGGSLAAETLIKEWLVAHQFDALAASYDPHDATTAHGAPLNVFSWFARNWRDLSPDGQKYLLRRLSEEERQSFWDAYPTMQVRVRTMRRFDSVARVPRGQARELFHDFDDLQQQMHDELFHVYLPSKSESSAMAARHTRGRRRATGAESTWQQAFRLPLDEPPRLVHATPDRSRRNVLPPPGR